MKPIVRTKRKAFLNGPSVKVANVNDEGALDLDTLNYKDIQIENGDMGFVEQNDEQNSEDGSVIEEPEVKIMTNEEIKVKSLNLAISMAKLLSGVTTIDIMKIAAKIAIFIKG